MLEIILALMCSISVQGVHAGENYLMIETTVGEILISVNRFEASLNRATI